MGFVVTTLIFVVIGVIACLCTRICCNRGPSTNLKNIEIPILGASARIVARLNYLCPQLFPAPGYWSIQDLIGTTLDSTASCEFILRPYTQLGLDRSGIPTTVPPSEIISGLLSEIPETAEAAQQVAQFWSGEKETRGEMVSVQDNKLMMEEPWLVEDSIPSCLEGVTREEMEIVLLGTGSSQPSKYRNVSSVYVYLFSKGIFLLDCGEGTLGQLKRRNWRSSSPGSGMDVNYALRTCPVCRTLSYFVIPRVMWYIPQNRRSRKS